MNSEPLLVDIEKTPLALRLEEELQISWDLVRKHPYDAGFDVRACIEKPLKLMPGRRFVCPTGLKIRMHSSHYEIQARPRSGLAAKYGITIVNTPGTIDFGYRDEIMMILLNTDPMVSFDINPGDRIGQLCFREIPRVEIEYVEQINLDNNRSGGFGSSGIR